MTSKLFKRFILKILRLLLLTFCFLSCSAAENRSLEPVLNASSTDLLLFLKERKIEIWSQTIPKKRLQVIDFDKKNDRLNIGKYTLVSDSLSRYEGLQNHFDKNNVTEVLIFPNDSRISGNFDPCFACTHSIAETYAKLELLLHLYPLDK